MLKEDEYYTEDGYIVLTSKYLTSRGICCHSNCRHCPYGDSDIKPNRPKEIKNDTFRQEVQESSQDRKNPES
jgi:hypothetical protein